MEPIHFKTYGCSVHPSELIQRLCLDSRCDQHLLCFECVKLHDASHKNNVVAFDEFFDVAVRSYREFDKLLVSGHETNLQAPQEYLSMIFKEDEVERNLLEHINRQKVNVETFVNEIQDQMLSICDTLKKKALADLDQQYWNLKSNFRFFKERLNKNFKMSGQHLETGFKKKYDLVVYLNKFNTYEHFAANVDLIRADILENQIFNDTKLNKLKILQGFMKDISVHLRRQSCVLPLPKFALYPERSKLVEDISNGIQKLFDDNLDLNYSIEEFNATKLAFNDSKIIQSYDDLMILKHWINPNRPVQLKLIYRGTRDGFSADTFHKLCDNHWPTLTLASSNYDRVFGGYTDQSWVSINHYKKSEGAFLFSLTHRKKCPVIPEHIQTAIYTHDKCFPCFGDNEDLSIVDRPNENHCTSTLGFAYENHGKGKADWLTGSSTFLLKEIEVFAVEC